jgi:hypothetical protein
MGNGSRSVVTSIGGGLLSRAAVVGATRRAGSIGHGGMATVG